MLKNSLYLNHYFPVYLFSGQRGCGKTSTARIFSAAINCQNLTDFRKNPKSSPLPCLTCQSCQAMLAGRHPDFFEIDAASHTGVDHIRHNYRFSNLIAYNGRKKIYLIDEAHMLSKASFNALLKVLEEPPVSVVFILATTDAHKIIETVKSRCFQLLFKPISSGSLIDHLTALCVAENIPYDTDGLTLIAQESDGSARDAINVLEQVRFSSATVNKASVLKVLGYIDDAQLVTLFKVVLAGNPTQLIAAIKRLDIASYAAPILWNRLAELARTAIWAKHGVESGHFAEHTAEIKRMVQKSTWLQLNDVLDQLYANEAVFLKTTAQHSLFEMILLQLCYKYTNGTDSTGSTSVPHASAQSTSDEPLADEQELEEDEEETEDDDTPIIIENDDYASRWVAFVDGVQTLKDPLLLSLFRQGHVINFEPSTAALTVEFSKDFLFFNDWMNETQAQWLPHLRTYFGPTATVLALFTAANTVPQKKTLASDNSAQPIVPTARPVVQKVVQQSSTSFYQKRASRMPNAIPAGTPIDISNTEQFAKAHMLLRHFPGSITEVRE